MSRAFAEITPLELFQALAGRLNEVEQLADSHGRVPPAVYQVLAQLTPMPFVDGFAVRGTSLGTLQASLIRRNTGPYTAKLCFVGGKIGQDQTFEQSFLYHWFSDLGVEVRLLTGTNWDEPLDTCQYMRHDPRLSDSSLPAGLGYDPGKNSCSHVFAVIITGGELRFGEKSHDLGTEAAEFTWEDPLKIDPRDVGYPGMYESFMRSWHKLAEGFRSGRYTLPEVQHR